ncbi:MAG: V-type ATPase subunit [Candidatus Bathyarchaeota archaeon]|nr:MAG: V-type ATPase subunit [Candidatus Bathyarchaeota archaeon]
MGVWKYKGFTHKVIVRKLGLIKQKDMTELAGRSLQDIFPMLKRTSYQTEISEIPVEQRNAVTLERAFLRNLTKAYQDIMKQSPKDIAALVSTILLKIEVNNVKTLLRAKAAELGVGEAMRLLTPGGRLDDEKCQRILHECDSIPDVVESLADLGYKAVLEEALSEYERTGVFLLFEMALDKYVYNEMWTATRKLKGLDGKIARTVIGIELDSINIKTILRCKALGISEEQTRHCLVAGSEILGEKELEEALGAADLKSSIEYLRKAVEITGARDYKRLLMNAQYEYDTTQLLSRLETTLDQGLLTTSLKMVKRYTPYYNIGLILAFLNLKWFEVRNLIAVTRGVEAGFSPEKIEKLLVLPR